MKARHIALLIGSVWVAGVSVAAVGLAAARERTFTASTLTTQPSTAAQPDAEGARVYKDRCASCHDAPDSSRSPSRANLSARSVAQIIAALEPGGVMAAQGQPLPAAEKQAVAAFLSSPTASGSKPQAPSGTPDTPPGAAAPAVDPAIGACAPSVINAAMPNPASLPMWNGWGNDLSNTRFQPAPAAGLTAAEVPKLTLKWAFAFPGATAASGQPTIAAGRVFVGNVNGMVYALDAKTGCTYWSFKADGGVRTAHLPSAPIGAGRHAVLFGDVRANVYGVDAQTGAQLWKVKVDNHAFARITGAPTFADGRLYVPVSSVEEVAGARPNYPCCTFRGSVVALDAATGKQIWKTYMIPDAPQMVGKNSAGHRPVEIRRCGGLDVADGRCRQEHGLCRHRECIHQSRGAHQRCGRRAQHGRRRDSVGAAGDAGRCVSSSGANRGSRTVPRRSVPTSISVTRRSSARCRVAGRILTLGPEIRRRLWPRSGQQRQDALAAARRQGWRARWHRMGIVSRRTERLCPGVGRAASAGRSGWTARHPSVHWRVGLERARARADLQRRARLHRRAVGADHA